jgi:hypothetical protein
VWIATLRGLSGSPLGFGGSVQWYASNARCTSDAFRTEVVATAAVKWTKLAEIEVAVAVIYCVWSTKRKSDD